MKAISVLLVCVALPFTGACNAMGVADQDQTEGTMAAASAVLNPRKTFSFTRLMQPLAELEAVTETTKQNSMLTKVTLFDVTGDGAFDVKLHEQMPSFRPEALFSRSMTILGRNGQRAVFVLDGSDFLIVDGMAKQIIVNQPLAASPVAQLLFSSADLIAQYEAAQAMPNGERFDMNQTTKGTQTVYGDGIWDDPVLGGE